MVAALAGGLGAAGVLLARERAVLLGGLALLGLAELGLVLAVRTASTGWGRPTAPRPAVRGAWSRWSGAAAVLVRRPGLGPAGRAGRRPAPPAARRSTREAAASR